MSDEQRTAKVLRLLYRINVIPYSYLDKTIDELTARLLQKTTHKNRTE